MSILRYLLPWPQFAGLPLESATRNVWLRATREQNIYTRLIGIWKLQTSSAMAPAKDHLHNLLVLLLFIGCLFIDAAAKLDTTAPCLPDQASSLLRLKASFIGDNLPSWQAATDCCHWEGVNCDMAFGRVISLDLSEFQLVSRRLDPALFNLTFLRNLSLASVDFRGFSLPAFGFERLTDIIYLNLSYAHFEGKIPIGIACLKNLVTIDLSDNDKLYFERPSFQTIMANMSNLRELYLDGVGLQNIGSDWSTVLADSVPQLQILSLSCCDISGSIHPSFSRLRSLTAINLGFNWRLTGKVPEYFSELSSLTILYIPGNQFEGQFPTKIFQLKSLRTLDLSWNPMLSVRLTYFPAGNNLEVLNLEGTNFSYDTPSSFANLESLKTLGLSTIGSDLENPVLSWVSNLTQLTNLRLDGYDFSTSVPTWIGKLTGLESLIVAHCSFSVPILYQIRNLTKLAALEFMHCDFSEQRMPSWIGNLTKLTSLCIYDCSLSGPIPSTIRNLIQLEELAFLFTDISGKIPKSLFALPVLQQLCLVGNQLVGSLEDIPAPLSSPLREIDLRDNQLTGPIPKSLFQLTNLEYLGLGSNKLTGTIELGSIWRLKNLTYLDLGNNMISLAEKEGDTIFSYSLKIQTLNLASCNLTKFPEPLKYLDTIQYLDLSNNQIEGAIPSWMWENRLVELNLSHNMFTTLEKSPTVQMTDLDSLDLSFNRIQGSIPMPSTPSDLVLLDYSNNDFSTMEPNFGRYLRSAIYINLSKNKLSGHVPLSFCSLNKLELMDLSYNNFSGPIPSCLMERVDLSILKIRGNKLHGVLPENIREGCKFQTIDFNENQIEGALPRSLANCQDLEVLDVGSNHIVDSFPSWMGTLLKLRILVLRSNQLYGTIRDLPRSYQHFTSLQIIDLASNHFSGDLHSEWFENFISMMNNSNDEGQILEHQTNATMAPLYQDTVTITFKDAALSITKILPAFKVIDLSNNSFEGSIPSSIGRLASLHGLNMSHNNFTGEIPSQLGNLTRKNTAGKPILVIS
nr:receptor-like protein 19 isoform X2 [Setaria viridis]